MNASSAANRSPSSPRSSIISERFIACLSMLTASSVSEPRPNLPCYETWPRPMINLINRRNLFTSPPATLQVRKWWIKAKVVMKITVLKTWMNLQRKRKKIPWMMLNYHLNRVNVGQKFLSVSKTASLSNKIPQIRSSYHYRKHRFSLILINQIYLHLNRLHLYSRAWLPHSQLRSRQMYKSNKKL